MAGFNRPYSLLFALFLPALGQSPANPLTNFCRRYGHQTAVIDNKLYIDGGWLYANPISENPQPVISKTGFTYEPGLIMISVQILACNMTISTKSAWACRSNMPT